MCPRQLSGFASILVQTPEGRSYRVMRDAFLRIRGRLPFPVLEIHPDNGSEFFNHHMRTFWQETLGPFQISRSRPYKKNDNRFVEQKNFTLVRAYLGYDRLDTVEQTQALGVGNLAQIVPVNVSPSGQGARSLQRRSVPESSQAEMQEAGHGISWGGL